MRGRCFSLLIVGLILVIPVHAYALVVPFVESNRYGCLQNGTSTELVRIDVNGGYKIERFGSTIKKTRSKIRYLRRQINKLKHDEASAVKIARARNRVANNRSLLSSLRNCRRGILPNHSAIASITPTPSTTISGSDTPCKVVGTTIGVNTRIINGEVCDAANSPVVQLELRNGNRIGLCSGTVISKRAVLTAAHCLVGVSGVVVHAGSVRSVASSYHYHPDYNAKNNDSPESNDIGIVSLDSNLPTRVIGIVSVNTTFVSGEKAIIAGYGNDEHQRAGILRAGTMTLTSASTEGIYSYFDGSGSNSCSGDSGGPYLVKRNGEWLIAGTTSWGTVERCLAGDRSFFANVASPSNQNFIRQYVPKW